MGEEVVCGEFGAVEEGEATLDTLHGGGGVDYDGEFMGGRGGGDYWCERKWGAGFVDGLSESERDECDDGDSDDEEEQIAEVVRFFLRGN